MHSQTSALQNTTNTLIPLSLIDPLPFGNCRTHRDSQDYQDLVNSIKTRGVIQPVLLRPVGNRFELVAGYGRFEASCDLELETIPSYIKNLTDVEAQEHQLEENVNRTDLDIIDECRAVQQLSVSYNGDRKAIATRLVWSIRKVNERIEILRCCDEVLEAVRKKTITVGHALILAPFSEKLQQGTLAKVITERWTVKYLRERASKGQQLLVNAKFDISECNTCPHNSAAQSGLFGLDDHKAACSQIKCFTEKTSSWLEKRKSELSEQFGTVLLVQQVSESQRNTVDVFSVGDTQFNTGCMACEKRVALVDDRLGRFTGTTLEDQCIDNICYSKCVAELQKENIEVNQENVPEVLAGTNKKTTSNTKSISPTAKAKGSKAVNCKVSSKVVETNKAMLRKVSAGLLMPESSFQQAMSYAALRRIATCYKPIESTFNSTDSFEAVLTKAMNADEETILAEIANVTLHLSSKETSSSINFTDVMIKALTQAENAQKTAITCWAPSKEILTEYTIGGLTVLCNESGFAEAFNMTKAGSFEKSAASGKGKFIDAILKFEFDWSGFAPKEYVSLIK